MDFARYTKPAFISLFAAALIFHGCSVREAISEKNFVGKWKSSKLETPIYLYANGEWEIKKDDGAVLQYGIWEFKNNKIIWSYKVDSYIVQDSNDVLSLTPQGFKVKESDRTTTTFNRLG